MSVQLSDCEFFERYWSSHFGHIPFIWESFLGNLLFPPPFSLLPQSVDGGERGGWWDGFDLHARVRDVLR